MPEGLILKGVCGFYQVESDSGLYDCKTRGIYRKKGITPLAGDFVDFTITDETLCEGWIEKIKERKNSFKRPSVANINQIAIVITAKCPAPDLLLVDKLLITTRIKSIEPIIIINKTDLIDSIAFSEMESIYRGTGYPVIPMNKVNMEGYDVLYVKLKGHRTVFAGQSGVGKSTILNNIIKSRIMETNEVSVKIQRGRHTTRHVQLIPMDSKGYVVDTPGFSSFELEGIEYGELAWLYPEIERLQSKCRFNGCSHINEPDCAVKDAVKHGDISGKRYECYQKLFEELKKSYDKRYR